MPYDPPNPPNQQPVDDLEFVDHLPPPAFHLEFVAAPPEVADATWIVRGFAADERLARPFRVDVDVITTDVDLDPERLLGSSAALVLERADDRRSFAGIVVAVEVAARDAAHLGLSVRIEPALGLLAHRRDRRVWADRSAVEIIEGIIDGPLAAHGRCARWQLRASYGPRAHCIQHGESDLELVHRLLAEEGIHYRFEVEGGREVVVFTDASPEAPVVEVRSADVERRVRGALPYVVAGLGSTGEEAIRELVWQRRLVSSATALRTWRWQAAAEPHEEALFEDYAPDPGVAEAGGDRTVYEIVAPDPGASDDEARRHAVRHQRRGLGRGRGRGEADAIHLRAGRRFAVVGHPGIAGDRGFLVLEAHHRGDAPEAQLHADAEAPTPRYRCTFTCAAAEDPYRPPTPSRPRPGLETAIVVGPEGEAIHTDEHGRIQVRFHWTRPQGDPIAAADDEAAAEGRPATAWLRVAQAWAGAGFGALFLPRIGHEVVVDYLGGDPDRPIVVGCLYNSLHPPPFTLPDDKAKSGLRSDSTPGGGGHHEISFDDTKGRETLRVRAQRDLLEHVLHDRKATIGNDRWTGIKGLDVTEVGGMQHLHVDGSATRWIGAHYDLTVDGGDLTTTLVSGSYACVVEAGDHRTRVDRGAAQVQAKAGIALLVDDGDLVGRAQGSVELAAATGAIQASASVGIGARTSEGPIRLTAETGPLELDARSGRIDVTPGCLDIRAGDGVRVRADKLVSETADTLIEATSGLVLKCGSSTIILKPNKIHISAASITSDAVGNHTISGALINLN
ncbi:MAG: type VI secretion system tip protein TssI/VgrG [Nannocystaceae bacterium]